MPKPKTRAEQLADAYEAVARANHYMVGIIETVTDDERDEAEQILIRRQNDLVGHHWPPGSPGHRHFHRKGGPFARLDLALDVLDYDRKRSR